MFWRLGGLLMAFACVAGAAEAEIKLVKPDTAGGKPLMEVINARRSNRNFSPKALTDQQLSDLLYAANGISGKDGRRTVPTARNVQDMDVYVALPQGMYLYDGASHSLKLAVAGDLRKYCGKQPFHGKAPLVLVYVSNVDKYKAMNMTAKDAAFYAPNHAGYISQNVYLYAASAGLSTVVCNMVDKKDLIRRMKLGPQYTVILTQPVGVPAE